jgi:hypothetical protein
MFMVEEEVIKLRNQLKSKILRLLEGNPHYELVSNIDVGDHITDGMASAIDEVKPLVEFILTGGKKKPAARKLLASITKSKKIDL